MKKLFLALVAMTGMAFTCTQTQAQFIYQNDDGTSENSVGIEGGGTFAWGNMFSVNSMDGSLLRSIEIGYGSDIAGSNVTWRVFNDDDGSPLAGLSLLSSGSYFVMNDDHPGTGLVDVIDQSSLIDITGADFLFITAEITQADGLFPAAIDEDSSLGLSWVTLGTGGTEDWGLQNTNVIDNLGLSGNWIIRGNAVVPEPSALAVITLLGGLAAVRRRR